MSPLAQSGRKGKANAETTDQIFTTTPAPRTLGVRDQTGALVTMVRDPGSTVEGATGREPAETVTLGTRGRTGALVAVIRDPVEDPTVGGSTGGQPVETDTPGGTEKPVDVAGQQETTAAEQHSYHPVTGVGGQANIYRIYEQVHISPHINV